MMEYKNLLGILTIAIGLVSYSFYFRDILKGKTKPEAYSWLIWGLLAAIAFFAQTTEEGGAGTWATALTAVVCLLIALTAFHRGEGRMKGIDEISLLGAFMGVILWKYTNDPLIAVLFVILIGFLGFVPTFYKVFYKPREETVVTFALNAVKFTFAFLALNSVSLVTGLYPAAMIIMNTSLVLMIFVRRWF